MFRLVGNLNPEKSIGPLQDHPERTVLSVLCKRMLVERC